MAGARETLSLSPTSPPPRLFRQDEFREDIGIQNDDYAEPPHPEVSRADEDISRHPTSPPPSLGEEAGGQEDDESDSSPDSGDSSEDLLDGTKYFVLDVLDLQRFRAVQLCTLGPPHSCEEYWYTHTEEENNIMDRWEDQCRSQLQAGERRRPDIKCDENGYYPFSFCCSMLSEIRRFRDSTETSRSRPPPPPAI